MGSACNSSAVLALSAQYAGQHLSCCLVFCRQQGTTAVWSCACLQHMYVSHHVEIQLHACTQRHPPWSVCIKMAFSVLGCLGMHQLLHRRFALCGKHATSVHRAAQCATTDAELSGLCLIKCASRHVETFVAERIFKLGMKSRSCRATVIMYTTRIVWRHG